MTKIALIPSGRRQREEAYTSSSLDRHGPNIGYVARAHLAEVAKMARKAERWGAPPQGERVMAFAYHLDQGTMLEAAEIRDQIRYDLGMARMHILDDVFDTASGALSNFFGAVGNVLLFALMCIPALVFFGGFAWFLYTGFTHR